MAKSNPLGVLDFPTATEAALEDALTPTLETLSPLPRGQI